MVSTEDHNYITIVDKTNLYAFSGENLKNNKRTLNNHWNSPAVKLTF